MGIKKVKSNEDKHYNWLMGADMYLCASIILCKEMLNTYKSPINELNQDQLIDKKCGFTSCNPDYEMLLPVIFNLKHGIELYLKSLTMQIDFDKEYPTSHDLVYLLNSLINLLKNKKNNSGILEILDKELRNIIEKYYFGIYAFSTIHTNPDINNEAERYPEYQNPNCYKIEKLYDIKNMNVLLEQIKEDSIRIQKLFREDVYKKII